MKSCRRFGRQGGMKQNNPSTPTHGWKLRHARMKRAITASAASTKRMPLPCSAPSPLSAMKLRVSRKENIRLISQNKFPRLRRHLHLAIPHSGGRLMNALISIRHHLIGQAQVQTVNARELHAFLENGARFNDWIKKRIADYGFQEGHDYMRFELPAGMKMAENGGDLGGIDSAQKNVALKSMGYSSFGQQGRIEYALTLDMAKELAMVERNAKGKQARQYFIECERRAIDAVHRDPIQILNDPAAMRGLLLTYSEKVIELESKLNAQAPKVEALDRIAMANGAMCITDAAKTLQIRPTELFGWLHSNRWIYRRPGNAGWLTHQDKLQSQVLQHKVVTIAHSDGSERVTEQVRVTAKGLTRLSEHFSLH